MAQAVTPINRDPQIEALKLPPYSVEAEQSVLGGLLLDNTAWEKIADLLTDADFYRADHRQIYRHISLLIEDNKPADALTVAESLERSAKLEEVGGQAYLGSLAVNTPSAANIRRYAEIVRERAIMRRLAEVGTGITDSVYNPLGRSAKDLLDNAEKEVFAIAEAGSRGRQGFSEIQPLLTKVVERIDTLYKRDNPSDVTGIATGFTDLDRMTSGLQPGDLVIVAGRPSMGKTALALNIAEHVALSVGMPAAIFSMEMSGPQLVMRMLGSLGRLDQHKMRTGALNDDDWQKLTTSVGRLNEAPIFIDESGMLNPTELRGRARPASSAGRPRPWSDRDRLPATDGNRQQHGKPRDRSRGNIACVESRSEGAQRTGCRVIAIESGAGTASEQASGHVGPARIRRHRAGCRPDPVYLSR